MARLSLNPHTQRTALLLYALLVVLPGAVFGGLLWRQLQQDQARQLEEVPVAVQDGATRFSQAMAARVRAILAEEENRNPLDYLLRDQSFDANGVMVSKPSVLSREERREGILAWFAQDPEAPGEQQLTVFRGREQFGRAERENTVRLNTVAQNLLSLRRMDWGMDRLGSSGLIFGDYSNKEAGVASSSPSRISSGREF